MFPIVKLEFTHVNEYGRCSYAGDVDGCEYKPIHGSGYGLGAVHWGRYDYAPYWNGRGGGYCLTSMDWRHVPCAAEEFDALLVPSDNWVDPYE